jgi:NADH-quinone oxidoreductase subunit C
LSSAENPPPTDDEPTVAAPASDDTGEKLIGRDVDATDVEKAEGAEAGTPDVAETAETGELSDAEAARAAREGAGAPEEGAAAPDPTPPAAEAAPPPPPEPEPAEPAERDERREAMVEVLRERLGDGVVEHWVRPGDDVWVRVTPEAWRQAGEVCRDRLACDYFCFLSAIDWMPSPFGRGEDDPTAEPTQRSTEIVQGVAGGETRFQVFARLQSTTEHHGLFLKCDVPDETMTVPSWVEVYAGADWHERETWEMYGISFAGHPNLEHIYLPGGFEGHPLRKDYPLLARQVKPWPGIVDVEPMPAGEDDADEASEETEGAAT